jgi:hypothetical protein
VHGGTVEVHSEGACRGTEVVVRLKLARSELGPKGLRPAGDNRAEPMLQGQYAAHEAHIGFAQLQSAKYIAFWLDIQV